MAGNGVVLKPASLTPLIGERIRQTFEKAGLPEGLVRTVHGGGRIGEALVESTGAARSSSPARSRSAARSGESAPSGMKGSVLELGGKDPQIVCADADLANAISGCVWGGFANAGQTCSGIERVYVVSDVADALHRGRRARDRAAHRRRPARVGHRDRPDGLGGAVRDRHRAGRRRRRERAPSGSPAARARSTGMNGELHRPDRADRRHARDADHEGGDLRPGAADHRRSTPRRRRSSSPTTPNFGLGASVWTKDRAKGERMAHADRVRDGLDQRPLLLPRRLPVLVGRRQGLRASAARTRSSASTSASNIKLVAWEPGWTRDIWWQPYDRNAGRGASAPRRGCSTAATASAPRRFARAADPAAAGRRPHARKGDKRSGLGVGLSSRDRTPAARSRSAGRGRRPAWFGP